MMQLFALARQALAAMAAKGELYAAAEKAVKQLGGPEAVLREVERACRTLTPGVYRYGGEGTGMYPTVYEVGRGWVYAHTCHGGNCSPESPCHKEVPVERAYLVVWPLDVIVQAARDIITDAEDAEVVL